MPPPVQNFYRYLFASLALASYFIIRREPFFRPGKNLRGLVFSSLSYAIASVLMFVGFKYTTIANTVVLFYTAPLFVAILAPFILKERPKRVTIIGLAIAFIGVLLLGFPSFGLHSHRELLGLLAGLGSGVAFASMILSTKAISVKMSFMQINFYQNLLAALVLLPSSIIVSYSLSAKALVLLLVIGVVHTAFARTLWVSGVSKVPAQDAGAIGYIEPLSASIFGLMFFSELPPIVGVIGAILILISSYLVTSKQS